MTLDSKKKTRILSIVVLVILATGFVLSVTGNKLAGSILIFAAILVHFTRTLIEAWGRLKMGSKEAEAGTGSDKSAN